MFSPHFNKKIDNSMLSQLYTDVYHLEENVYINDDLVICRFFKLVVVFHKTKNVFSYYLLKRSKESNISNVMNVVINTDNPEQKLLKLIGDNPPDPLSCSVDGYEVKLIPQSLGGYDVLITHETKQSLTDTNMEMKTCIVYLNDFLSDNPVNLFRQMSSGSSPNRYASTNLVTVLKNVFDGIPSHFILLLSLKSLQKNISYIPEREKDVVIYLLRNDSFFEPVYPGMNFTVIYLNEDKHLAEPLLPATNSKQPHFLVRRLNTLKGFFSI